MVSANERNARRGQWALVTLVTATVACAKIVGITDTVVDTAGAPGTETGGGGGHVDSGGGAGRGAQGGVSSGGASTGGTAGGVATGGSSAGHEAGGKGGGGTGGADGGTGGALGGKGGSGGSGGSMTTGGAGGASGTSGGTTSMSGEGGMAPDCGGVTSRCTSDGKLEVCKDGTLQTMACPLDQPACDAGACVNRGPTMVKVTSFYIDGTEVTVGQYDAFTTAKNGDTSGQDAVCSWNTSYAPSKPPGGDTLPVSYVDWCDAAAYCKWAGKHLCSGIDMQTLTYGTDGTDGNVFDETVSQWFLACGNGGYHPNGNPMCNSNDGFDPTAPVGTFPGCESAYYPGIFDMEGNVAEWVDLCVGTAGATDTCYPLGGSTVDQKSYCDEAYDSFVRSDTAYTVGFRCCSG